MNPSLQWLQKQSRPPFIKSLFTVTNLSSSKNFSNRSATSSVTGIQFDDENENGVFDDGELPLAGVTVFIDTNGNNLADAVGASDN